MTHEIAQLNGGIVSVENGSLEWIDNSQKEVFEDKSEFKDRLSELTAES